MKAEERTGASGEESGAPEHDGRQEQGEWREVAPEAARRLVVAAVEAFAERGYHATTTRDIAGRAGMSPAALYIHYRTKEELLFRISRTGHAALLALLTEARDAPGAPAERLDTAVRTFVVWQAVHQTTARVVSDELGALSPAHHAEVMALRREGQRVLASMLTDGVAAGSFDVPDVSGTALAILSLCVGVARWYQPEGERTPEQIAALYAALVARMVAAG